MRKRCNRLAYFLDIKKHSINNASIKNSDLGEFEELVLFTVGVLNNEAYSIANCNEINRITKGKVGFAVVHSALNRLEEKGYV